MLINVFLVKILRIGDFYRFIFEFDDLFLLLFIMVCIVFEIWFFVVVFNNCKGNGYFLIM